MKLQNQKLFQAVYGFSLILGFCHHLVPQIGVLHLRDIGVSESTPGPIMVNLATYVGTSQAGFIGAMIATFAVVLPSFLIMLAVTAVLPKVIKNKYVQAALRGIKPSMIGIILATGCWMIFKNLYDSSFEKISIRAVIITAILCTVYFGQKKILKKSVSPIMLAGYGWIRTITEHNIRIYHSTRLRGKFQFARSIKEIKK